MPSQIEMFFRFPSGFLFRVPVIPPDIMVRDGSQWDRVDVLGLGTVGTPAFRKPQEITFSSFFPYQYDPSYCQYAELMHPADAANMFVQACGFNGGAASKRPAILRFSIIEEYEAGLWTTHIEDDFALEEFSKEWKAAELTDQHYTIMLRTIRIPTLRATGALAANIGTQKPHPNNERQTSNPDTQENSAGKTPAKVTRQKISPTNLQLRDGTALENVDPQRTGVDPTSPIAGAKYSYTSPDGASFGRDSTPEVTMSNNFSANALGTYVDPGQVTPPQITRDEYTNNGGFIIIP